MTDQIKNTIEALKKNNMEPFYAQTKEEVLAILKTFVKKGDTIGLGGSVTLNELGILDFLKDKSFNLIDRYEADITDQERTERLRKSLISDVFLTSSNAVTENGELINTDGNGNRVAALIYGPKSVIVIVGVNKIVKNIEEGFLRIKNVSAPLNCKRLNKKNYCYYNGKCMGLLNENSNITNGCMSETRICCNYTIQGYQQLKGRIKVIICNKSLGY